MKFNWSNENRLKVIRHLAEMAYDSGKNGCRDSLLLIMVVTTWTDEQLNKDPDIAEFLVDTGFVSDPLPH